MGITYGSIERMEKLGLFGKGRIAVLDIGSSNLYSADAERIEAFLGKYSSQPVLDTKAFAQRLARGSGYDPVRGGLNESFVGELFEKAGMEYRAFDIADGYRTQIMDLNHAVLPQNLRNHFDLVLNFGTTEHILNQYNCFKVIHDATKVGGYIHHSLPAMGYADHGYITYTSRCFFDIAGYNEYEVVDFWFDGPSGRNDALQGLRSYSSYFPAVKRALDEIENSSQGAALKAAGFPDVGICIVFRKVKDKPFWGALESSTSVGNIPTAVTASYAGKAMAPPPEPRAAPRPAHRTESIVQKISRSLQPYPGLRGIARRAYRAFSEPPVDTSPVEVAQTSAPTGLKLTEGEATLRDRLINESLSFDEALGFYTAVVNSHGTFPYDWEERVLRLGIAKYPERTEFVDRLDIVLDLLGKKKITVTA